MNLLTFFRISLFEHILMRHSDSGWANRLVDDLVDGLLEFKAFDLFSFTFGIGIAIQAERAIVKGINVPHFLLRRFLVLFGLGLCHLLFVSNVDILLLYALCGLMLVPVLRLPAGALAMLGVVGVWSVFPTGLSLPPEHVLRVHAAEATRVYRDENYLRIFLFRWRETCELIVPLLLMSLQKTIGLMALGIAAWRTGVLRNPEQHRRLLWTVLCCAGAIGGTALVFGVSSYVSPHILAAAYAAGVFLWSSYPRLQYAAKYFAGAGQMALTNYLTQSVVLSLLFYGYGFGLFGRISSSPAAITGLAIYAGQLAFSRLWLQRYRFGPVEWLWRSLTYGCRQPMRL